MSGEFRIPWYCVPGLDSHPTHYLSWGSRAVAQERRTPIEWFNGRRGVQAAVMAYKDNQTKWRRSSLHTPSQQVADWRAAVNEDQNGGDSNLTVNPNSLNSSLAWVFTTLVGMLTILGVRKYLVN